MAATMTSYPCARAASSTRKGNLPLPAMRPRRVMNRNHVGADAFVRPAERSSAEGFDCTVPWLPRPARPDRRMRPSLREQPPSPLLNHSAFGGFDESDEHFDIFAQIGFGLQLFDRLRCVQLRG